MTKSKNTLTLMADYSADGLWHNGFAIEYDYLIDKLKFSSDLNATQIESKIESWQKMYESFPFWDATTSAEEIFASRAFHSFIILGREIALELKEFVPDDLIFEYFDERTQKRYIIDSDKTFIEKKRKD